MWKKLLESMTGIYKDPFLQILKGLVHPKMKILSVFTHPHVVPTP